MKKLWIVPLLLLGACKQRDPAKPAPKAVVSEEQPQTSDKKEEVATPANCFERDSAQVTLDGYEFRGHNKCQSGIDEFTAYIVFYDNTGYRIGFDNVTVNVLAAGEKVRWTNPLPTDNPLMKAENIGKVDLYSTSK